MFKPQKDTMGSFTCVCPVGFTLANDGSCIDVNECALGGHNCQAGESCLNLPGGVACFSKLLGYKMSRSKP